MVDLSWIRGKIIWLLLRERGVWFNSIHLNIWSSLWVCLAKLSQSCGIRLSLPNYITQLRHLTRSRHSPQFFCGKRDFSGFRITSYSKKRTNILFTNIHAIHMLYMNIVYVTYFIYIYNMWHILCIATEKALILISE